MTKVHKIVICVVDHDRLGADEIKTVLENANYPNDCVAPSVTSIETREVEWSDDHPLNFHETAELAFAALFTDEEVRR